MKRDLICRHGGGEWLLARHDMVTASECGAVLGMLPEKWGRNRETVIASKRTAAPEELAQSRSMWWGTEDERDNLRKFSLLTGLRVRQSHAMYRAPGFPRVGATLDGICAVPRGWTPDAVNLIGVLEASRPEQLEEMERLADEVAMHGRLGLVEAKLTSQFSVKEWAAGCPEWYEAQVQIQLLCAGLRWAALVCRIGSADMRWRTISLDEERARAYAAEMQATAEEALAGRNR